MRITIECMGCGVLKSLGQFTAPSESIMKEIAAKIFNEGWKIIDGRYYCEKCKGVR